MIRDIKLKVCGMKEAQNISELLKLPLDYMGFIFYDKSPRNVTGNLDADLLLGFPKSVKKVGVFVNSHVEFIQKTVQKYQLDILQLHGYESALECQKLNHLGFEIIKAFSVNEDFDFSSLEEYSPFCKYFLFDTKGKNLGGNGIKFDWKLLDKYTLQTPFFLSGGVDLQDIEEVNALKTSKSTFFALDVNSKFEISPGLKNVEKVRQLIEKLK